MAKDFLDEIDEEQKYGHHKLINLFVGPEHHAKVAEIKDPDLKMAYEVMNRIDFGMGAMQGDMMHIVEETLAGVLVMNRHKWGDPRAALQVILDRVIKKFPQEEWDGKLEEPPAEQPGFKYLQRPVYDENWQRVFE